MTVQELIKRIDEEISSTAQVAPITLADITLKLKLLEKVALYWRDDKPHFNNDVMDHLVRNALDQ